MLKIEVASGISFHVFWNAVEGLNGAIGKPFLVNFPVLINDFNVDEGVDDFLEVLVQKGCKAPEHFKFGLSVERNEFYQCSFNL